METSSIFPNKIRPHSFFTMNRERDNLHNGVKRFKIRLRLSEISILKTTIFSKKTSDNSAAIRDRTEVS